MSKVFDNVNPIDFESEIAILKGTIQELTQDIEKLKETIKTDSQMFTAYYNKCKHYEWVLNQIQVINTNPEAVYELAQKALTGES